MKKLVVDFKAISERLCYMRLRGKYVLTEDKDLEIRNEFYEELSQTTENIPRYEVKITLGDLNASVGRKEEYQCITREGKFT